MVSGGWKLAVATKLELSLRGYLRTTVGRPWIATAVVAAVTASAVAWLVLDRPLRLDTDLADLLPDDLPCVAESRRISKRIGSIDSLIVVVQSPSPADNIAFSDALLGRIAALDEIKWATNREDRSYFREHRLLYLDVDDLETVVARVKARVDYEKRVQNPFYVALDDERPPDIEFDDIMERYATRLKGAGATRIIASPTAQAGEFANPDDHLASPDGTVVSIVARPVEQSTDMAFGAALVAKIERLIRDARPVRPPGMRVEIAGPYRNRTREYENIVHDIFSSVGISLGLIVLVIVAYFRRARAIALIFIPLLVGMAWTVAVTALTLGRLSITTALIFAVLLGLGIDFGVHMSVRYLDERARGRTLEDSLALSVVRTGRAALTAAITTAGAMAVLLLAGFEGFSEFGAIATSGILISYLVYVGFLPSLAALFERASMPRPWRRRGGASEPTPRLLSGSRALLGGALLVILALTVAGAIAALDVRFEYDFKNLRGRDTSTTIKYGKSLGQGRSSSVALLPTADDARRLTRQLQRIIERDTKGRSPLKQVVSLHSFIPEDQADKIPLLRELGGYVDQALSLRKLTPEARRRLEEIKTWTAADPIRVESLPGWVRDRFREVDGTLGRMVFLYPRTDEWDVRQISRFYEKFGVIDLPGTGQVRLASSSFILVEVVGAAQRDGVLITAVAAAVVFLVLLADFGSLRQAAFVFLPLLVGLSWTALAMVLLDVRVGLYNLLVLPTLLGIGIDASVHIYHAYRERGFGSLPTVIRVNGGAVLISSLTTAIGFLGAMMTTHDGLRSIGALALLGISVTTVAALVTMPLLLGLREALRFRGEASDPPTSQRRPL